MAGVCILGLTGSGSAPIVGLLHVVRECRMLDLDLQGGKEDANKYELIYI